MTRRYGTGARPVDSAIEGSGVWPDCEVDPQDWPAVVALAIARATRDASLGTSRARLARQVGVSHTTLGRLIHGEIWATVATVAALEDALGRPVWPQRDHE